MAVQTQLIGRVMAGTYRIERLLGQGGMGAVYVAQHVRTGGHFALKVLHREAAESLEIFRRFQDEARMVSALRHPNIVQVTDFDQDDDGTHFIVMEYLEGRDLHQCLRAEGTLSLPRALDLALQVGSALQAAHDHGIVHRDVKPQNIFLVRHELADGVHEIGKVLDFGISKIRRSESQATRTAMILGTPQFMSPEAARGQNAELDGRADQWALAVILYHALSGRLPFIGMDPMAVLYQVVHEAARPLQDLVPGLPGHVVAAITRGMSKAKEGRFPTINDFVRALVGNTASSAHPRLPSIRDGAHVPSAGGPGLHTTLSQANGHASGGTSRRTLRTGGAVAGVLVLACLGAAGWMALTRHPHDPPRGAPGPGPGAVASPPQTSPAASPAAPAPEPPAAAPSPDMAAAAPGSEVREEPAGKHPGHPRTPRSESGGGRKAQPQPATRQEPARQVPKPSNPLDPEL